MTRYHRPAWVAAFLVYLYEHKGEVTLAAELSGVSRRTVYGYRHRSQSFASMWDQVRAQIEAEAAARARRSA